MQWVGFLSVLTVCCTVGAASSAFAADFAKAGVITLSQAPADFQAETEAAQGTSGKNLANNGTDTAPVQLAPVEVRGEGVGREIEATEATAGVLGDLPLIEAPYSIDVITQDLLDIQQSVRYTDYLKNVPAANIGNVTIGFFSLRGFPVGTDGYLYDGLPGHAALSETYQLDGFERIEVFKGPSAFLNGFGGSSSLGGTLNYVPKYAPEEAIRSLEVDYTNRALFSMGADVGDRFGGEEQFGARLNARYRDGEQQAEGYDWTQKAATLALDWRATPDLVLRGNFEYADNHLPEIPPFFVVAPGVPVPDAPDASDNIALSWDDFRTQGRSAYLRADWGFAEDWTLTGQALSSKTERRQLKEARFGIISDAAGNATLSGGEDGSDIESDSAQLLLRGRLMTGSLDHHLTLGATVLNSKTRSGFVEGTGVFPTNLYDPLDYPAPARVGAPLVLSQKVDATSFLVSDIVDFSERWSVLLAARRAKLDQENFDTLTGTRSDASSLTKTSPTAALMFKPVKDTLLYVSYAEGLEQGGVAPTGTINQDERLPPLITEQVELGAKLQWREMTYTTAIFELDRPSEFVDNSGRFVQSGRQRHRGVEVTATGRLLSNLAVIAGTAWLDPVAEQTGDPTTDGKRPVSVPRVTANLFADYGLKSVPGLYLNAGVYHNTSQFLDAANTQELKGWTRFDVGARYETAVGPTAASFALGIENVANKDYWIGQDGILTIADPLTVKASARFDL